MDNNEEKITRSQAFRNWAICSLGNHALKDQSFINTYEAKSGDEFTPMRSRIFASAVLTGISVGFKGGFLLGAGITALSFVLINNL